MRPLLRLLDRCRPAFAEGGRLARLRPVFDAFDTFFYAPAANTDAAPHVRDSLNVQRYMSLVVIALLPCAAAAVYYFGLRVLGMIAVSYVVGGTVELAFAAVRRKEVGEGFLVTGLIFALILPPTCPYWLVGSGIAFGVIVGKELFGGTGRNLFNPALLGRCYLSLAYPADMSGRWVLPGSGTLGRLAQYVHSGSVDALTVASPLADARQGGSARLWDLFIGAVPGSAGETCVPAIVIGGLFLILTGVVNWRTTVGILVSYAALGALLHRVAPGAFPLGERYVLAGGLLLGAFFMATDPVTGPATNAAKWVYGGLIGVLTVLIRNLTGNVEGVTFAILMGNAAAPILDEVVLRVAYRGGDHEE